jgi:hypothetical protein
MRICLFSYLHKGTAIPPAAQTAHNDTTYANPLIFLHNTQNGLYTRFFFNQTSLSLLPWT